MNQLIDRDLVVMGASAGGIEAFVHVLGHLADFPVPILAVQHLGEDSQSQLPELLARRTPLPVAWATDGERLVPGRVLFAPPGRHLLVDGQNVMLREGPRENRARPAINRLFRTAAASHGAGVVAVVMSGLLDDGAAGVVAVHRAGGHVMVQDPSDALQPAMPRHAFEAVPDAEVVPLRDIADRLRLRIAERASQTLVPRDVLLEAELDRTQAPDVDALRTLGPQTRVSCPECGGPTWELGTQTGTTQYRCYLGHSTSARSLLGTRASAYEALARDAPSFGAPRAAESYGDRAAITRTHVDRMREFLASVRRDRR